MENFDQLQKRMRLEYPDLSPRLQHLLSFAISHPHEMALETISEIAQKAQAPPSSLVRFAKHFGFQGFSSMQKVFRSGLVSSISNYRQRTRDLEKRLAENQKGITPPYLDYFIEGGIESLNNLRQSVNESDLKKVVELLAESKTVYLVAQRRSFPVAFYLHYALSHLGKPAQLLDSLGGMLSEQGKVMKEGDALFAVSFPPYAPEVLNLVKDASLENIKIIGLTDSPLSPLLNHTNVHLEVHEKDRFGFRGLSFPAMYCLALCLVFELGRLMDHQNGS